MMKLSIDTSERLEGVIDRIFEKVQIAVLQVFSKVIILTIKPHIDAIYVAFTLQPGLVVGTIAFGKTCISAIHRASVRVGAGLETKCMPNPCMVIMVTRIGADRLLSC